MGKKTCNTYEVFAEMILTKEKGSVHASPAMEIIESDVELTHLFSGWFVQEALKTGEYLLRETGMDINISINILAFQTNLPDFYDEMVKTIKRYRLEPSHIQFELSEAQRLTQTGIENLNHIHDEFGVKLLLGNFGTGYSNLDILRHVHFDGIELDKSFAINVPDSDTACKLLVAIKQFADTLNMVVCAKGIETAEQMEFFEHLGFFKGQGYLIGVPMPIPQLADFIRQHAQK